MATDSAAAIPTLILTSVLTQCLSKPAPRSSFLEHRVELFDIVLVMPSACETASPKSDELGLRKLHQVIHYYVHVVLKFIIMKIHV